MTRSKTPHNHHDQQHRSDEFQQKAGHPRPTRSPQRPKSVRMTLTPQHLKTVRAIDAQAGKLLKRGGEEALMGGLQDLMLQFKPVLEPARPADGTVTRPH